MNLSLKAIADHISAKPLESSGDIYHPLPFPEFSNLKTSSKPESTYRKWSSIQSTLPLEYRKGKIRVLDVGANAGFYSFSFAKEGASVDAFEPHKHYVDIGRKIVESTGLDVSWFQKPLETIDLENKNYEVALLLSVFQWISQGNNRLIEATNLLADVLKKSRILYFELGCNSGKSAINTREPSILWIWKLLKDNCEKSVYYLGSSIPWRGGRRYLFACADLELNLNSWQKFITKTLSTIHR